MSEQSDKAALEPLVLYLCETEQLILKPHVLYRFQVGEGCSRCSELAAANEFPAESAPECHCDSDPATHYGMSGHLLACPLYEPAESAPSSQEDGS